MFFIYVANGPGESLLLSSLGPAASLTSLLCVIVVTIALTLLMMMCVCSQKTTSMKLQNNSASVAVNENRISLRQLSKTEDIESQLTEANKEEANNGEIAKDVPENGRPATSVTQLTMVQLKEKNRPTSHPSPCLPPRNPHNFHGPVHPSNQSSASVQVSARASTPASLERVHDASAANRTPAASSTGASSTGASPTGASSTGASSTGKENSVAANNSPLPKHFLPTCRVQPDYEEVNLPEKPERSADTKVDDCDDNNIYQDIDLNQESNSQQKPVKNPDSLDPYAYAEFRGNSTKSSITEQAQSKATSTETSEPVAPAGSRSAGEIPQYAKVDKSKKNSPLANDDAEDGLTSQEVASSTVRPGSSNPATNVTELYTQVHKPNRNTVSDENVKDVHATNSHESEKCVNSTAVDGEMVLNPCYATTMLRNYQNGAAFDLNSTEPLEVQMLEEPGYSTVDEEHANTNQNLDPGYSSIYETQHVYSEIALANAQGQVASGAATNATGSNPTDPGRSAKEPIYELVDATPRDEHPNQRL